MQLVSTQHLKYPVATILMLSLIACSSPNQHGLVGAVATPLNDLNLVREKIPPLLIAAKASPYAVPADKDCDSLESAIRALDEVLEPDVDNNATGEKPNLVEKGADLAGQSAVDTLRATTESVIPFRSWIRKLTGAERHSREVATAIAAGVVRRAFLKGMRAAQACEANNEPS